MFNRACRVVKLCVKAVLRALITVEPYARIGHVRFIGGDGSRELSLPGRSNCRGAKYRLCQMGKTAISGGAERGFQSIPESNFLSLPLSLTPEAPVASALNTR